MSVTADFSDFVTYLPNGQAVCAAHHLDYCGKCCLDFRDGESEDDGSEELNNDRVFVLGTGVNRFLPQWDEQLLGPGDVLRIKKNYDIPPHPSQLQASDLSTCDRCQLTWLVGHAGCQAATSHPSHHTLSHQYAGTRRSLVVHTDGACINNGQFNPKAGVGVYFGPNSRYNISKPLDNESSPTNQKAELEAILHAMQIVRQQIVGTRANFVNGNRDKQHFRLVIATDSSYAVECLCKHWENWEEVVDGQLKVLRNRKGQNIMNSQVFLAIRNEVEKLSFVGIQVVYYHVRREFNKEADALAKASVTDQPSVQQPVYMTGYAVVLG